MSDAVSRRVAVGCTVDAEGKVHDITCFGLIHIDYQTHARTLKDSALLYAKIIQTNGNEI